MCSTSVGGPGHTSQKLKPKKRKTELGYTAGQPLHYMGTAVWSDCGFQMAPTNGIHNTSLAIMYMLLSTHTSLSKHLHLKAIKGRGFLGDQTAVYEVS